MRVILIGKVKMSLAFHKTIYSNKNFKLVGVLTDIKKEKKMMILLIWEYFVKKKYKHFKN